MNQQIKEKWVKALRSGEYKQGTNRLKRKGESDELATYCCLGVLCDIFSKETNTPWVINESGTSYRMINSTSFLPYDVCKWAEISLFNSSIFLKGVPYNNGSSNCKDLITINDTLKYTFEQIADLIEKQV